ncbi:MAG: DUF2336 domain-containing protein [Rhodospirillales bacterium]|nr:DUF2336 domain-containing protein [Rhodospirillales bacterium]
MASHEDPAVRQALAARPDVMPEILFFLAGDPSPQVRQALAGNVATPRKADLQLAADSDDSVRSRLAGKIAGILPGLSEGEATKLGHLIYEALDLLARDQVVRVRSIVADALKDVAHAPPEVINRLARDSEIVVAGPILENSPVLTDEDLVAIVSESPVKGALAAIARRDQLAGVVADAVARTGDVEAVGVLLTNASAQIREDTLDWILERAPGVEGWHGPLIRRPGLPGGTALRIARFVADSLLKTLMEREDFDKETFALLRAEVGRRLDSPEAPRSRGGNALFTANGVDAPMPRWKRTLIEIGRPLDAALSLQQAGGLDSLVVLDALEEGDDAFVLAALAVLAGIPFTVAHKIVDMQSAKGIVALAWKAGVSERMLAPLQNKLCRIAPADVLKPRPGGGFPLTTDEMAWQLEFFNQIAGKG